MRLSTSQESGLTGRLVGGMIRRSVRQRFRQVLWSPLQNLTGPCIFVCNHHSWFDGYLMFHVVTKLGVQAIDWIEEFDAFPLFARVGGLPFPPHDQARRMATLRQTVRDLKGGKSLVHFPEGVLHEGPEILPFTPAIAKLKRLVPTAQLVETAIVTRLGIHERPTATINLRLTDCVSPESLAEFLESTRQAKEGFEVLVQGTKDVNERLSMRDLPWKK